MICFYKLSDSFLYSGLMRVCFKIKYFIGLVMRRERKANIGPSV